MKISILIPSFNQRVYLEQTLRSVLEQAGAFELEVIVMDGASTDGTVGLLKSVGDPRLTWRSEKDRGQSHALNKAFAMASGDVVGWLNSDDLYEPGALAAVVETFTADADAQWLVGRCRIIDGQGREVRQAVTRYKDRCLRRYSRRALLRQNFISQMSVFYRRGFAQSVACDGDLVDESLYWCMDYDLWLRMARRRDPRIIDRVLACFRWYPQSKSGAVDRRQFDEQYEVAKRYFDGDVLSRLIHRLNVEKIVWAYRVMARV